MPRPPLTPKTPEIDMTTPAKPPTNKWRVTVGKTHPQTVRSFRSENKTYEFVREQLPHGHRIKVEQWMGRWLLFEVFDEQPPADSPEAADQRLADN